MALKPATKTTAVKLGQEVTPVGSALFVSAPRPSQFDDTKIEAGLILSAEDYATFIGRINTLLKEHEAELPAPIAQLKMPFKEATDAEGNPTGEMILKSKTGVRFAPKFFDANGQAFNPGPDFQVANRSKIRLAVSFEAMKTSMFTGVVCRLNGIKMISASPWSGSNPFGDTQDEGDFAYGDSPVGATVADDEDWANR
jgi:hypothetical protein